MFLEEKIAARAAKEIGIGEVFNCGIGIPSLIPKFIPIDRPHFVHTENGIFGVGPPASMGNADRNLIDAGATYVTIVPGASFFDMCLSFSLVRTGRLSISFLGALQVSETGDLANWTIPGKYSPGIGGAMELAQKANRVVVTMTHTAKDGSPKILDRCKFPITAKSCVCTIITELAVIDVTPTGLLLREASKEANLDDIFEKTGARLKLLKGDIDRF